MSKSPNKTKVTNGTKLLPGHVDGRTLLARRYRDLVAAIAADLGGPEVCTTLQQSLIRRCAMLGARCEAAEALLVSGKPVDDERYASDVALLVRLSRVLGIARRAKDVNGRLDLKAYLSQRTGRALEHEPLDYDAEDSGALDHDPGDTIDHQPCDTIDPEPSAAAPAPAPPAPTKRQRPRVAHAQPRAKRSHAKRKAVTIAAAIEAGLIPPDCKLAGEAQPAAASTISKLPAAAGDLDTLLS